MTSLSPSINEPGLVKKAWGGVKAAMTYAVIALIVISYSSQIPLQYGERAIYEQLDAYELLADEVEKLVDQGGDPNFVDEYGDSILHISIEQSEEELVLALIENGANPMTLDSDGWTALESALYYGSSSLIDALLSNTTDLKGHKNLYKAFIEEPPSIDIIESLRAKGFDLHYLNEEGKNLLQIAIENYSDTDFITYLIGKNLSQDFTIEGEMLVDYLREQGRLDVVRVLEGNVPDISPERLAEINKALDEFVVASAKKIYEDFEGKLSGVSKLAFNAIAATADEDFDDLDPEEYRDHAYEIAMVTKLSHLRFDEIVIQCERIGFESIQALKAEVEKRRSLRQETLEAADLIVELDNMILFEDRERLPSDLLTENQQKTGKIENMFLDADKDSMITRCQSQLDKFASASNNNGD